MSVYQMKIALRDVTPPIWRRVQVPGDVSLSQLHEVLVKAFGWRGDSAHEFELSGDTWTTPAGDSAPDEDVLDDRETTLDSMLATGARFLYIYDLEDRWVHELEVERVLDNTAVPGAKYCLGGARGGPDEDPEVFDLEETNRRVSFLFQRRGRVEPGRTIPTKRAKKHTKNRG